MQITLPKLLCPIEPAINAHVRASDDHTAIWLRKFNLLPDDAAYANYRKQGFAYMVARMFPTASPPMLDAITDINTLLFLLDDQIDHQQNGGSGIGKREHLEQFVKEFISVLVDRTPCNLLANPFLAALAEFWERMCQMSTVYWQATFIAGVEKTFDAAFWQLNNIENGYIPTVAEFINYRGYLGAANIATDTIPVATGINVDCNNPDVMELTQLCRNIVCWANDLYSLSKEITHGDIYNLVLMLQHEHSLMLEDAIALAVAKHDRDMRSFVTKSRALLVQDSTPELAKYVKALKNIIRGNVDWSENETTRYEFTHVEW